MFALSGLFAATNTTIREGRAAFPDFVFGVLADGGVVTNHRAASLKPRT